MAATPSDSATSARRAPRRASSATRRVYSPRYVSGERSIVRCSSDAPATIDLSLTGRCQLRCEWCWGTEHHIGEVFPVQAWTSLLDELGERGTRHVVLTGGEPFLSPYLEPVLTRARALALRTTLSTNGIRLARDPSLHRLLEHVDDVGIPLDGHSAEINAVMRKRSGNLNGWRHAVDALKIAQAIVPSVTVRTVVSKKNLQSVPLIPAVLKDEGVDIQALRFKCYQIEPIGPHYSSTNWSEWEIDVKAVRHLARDLTRLYPELDLTVQLYKNTVGRYFRIDPDGRAFGTDSSSSGAPKEVAYGNVFEGLNGVLAMWQRHTASLKGQ